jgi:coenzyme F420-reducing hydrogenase alpha subunit
VNKVVIDPLTRVEGHGRVELLLRDGRVADVRVRLLESPRLFERIVVGRKYDEVPELVCRICAICSAVHKLTALEAVERALGVELPPLARAIRELLLLGGHIQSHALHLFCLVLPDFFAAANVVELLQKEQPLAAAGLKLKAFGNRIQELAGGRVIHPVTPIVGGVLNRPRNQPMRELITDLEFWLKRWPGYAADFNDSANFPPAQASRGIPLAVRSTDEFTLQGNLLRFGEGREVPAADYRQVLNEQTRDDSYAKQSAGGDAPYFVGALARARLRGDESGLPGTTGHGGFYRNNTAQLKEIGWALGRAHELAEVIAAADSDDSLGTKVVCRGGGAGTAVMEAPRGLLVHQYVIDEWGDVVAADVVTPTAINQLAMKQQILADLADVDDVHRMREVTEQIVRAFDPCISCAVHVLEG